jgi:hypothetical protein
MEFYKTQKLIYRILLFVGLLTYPLAHYLTWCASNSQDFRTSSLTNFIGNLNIKLVFFVEHNLTLQNKFIK